MVIHCDFIRKYFAKFSSVILSGCIKILLVLIIVLFTACAEKRMSLKEAKQVTVSMSEKSFVPPPRRIGDILAVLDEPGQFDPEITEKLSVEALLCINGLLPWKQTLEVIRDWRAVTL